MKGESIEKLLSNKEIYKALKDLYLHGKMNVNSPPLTFKQVRHLAKKLGIPNFKVIDLEPYIDLARTGEEPLNAVLFKAHENQETPGVTTGHFIGAYTDPKTGVIHVCDSFGSESDSLIIPGRKVINSKSVVQPDSYSNCGYLALLFVATHGSVKPVDKNPKE